MHRYRHRSWLLCFSSLSLRPQYPRLVFPPTLPIILDVITHHNVTHKGKRLLRLETDPSRTLWSSSHRNPTDGPVFACFGFAENIPLPEIITVFCQIEGIGILFCYEWWSETLHAYKQRQQITGTIADSQWHQQNSLEKVSLWKWRYWATRSE